MAIDVSRSSRLTDLLFRCLRFVISRVDVIHRYYASFEGIVVAPPYPD